MRIMQEYPNLEDGSFVASYDFTTCYTRRNPDSPIGELDLAVAVLRTGGVLSDISRFLHRSRRVVATAIAENPAIEELLEEVAEELLDRVEQIQKDAALSGDLSAGRFILTTIGKDRGYTTKTNTDHSNTDGSMRRTTIDLSTLSPEALEAIVNAADAHADNS